MAHGMWRRPGSSLNLSGQPGCKGRLEVDFHPESAYDGDGA
jgi:hypothetical protein